MKNKQIARIFDQIADILEFKNELPFKINAYRRASRTLEEMVGDVQLKFKDGSLQDVPGIGKAMLEKIGEYLQTGRMQKYEQEKASVPDGLMDLLAIQNLGPKTLALLHSHLGVKNLSDLKTALDSEKFLALPGMGVKKAENIRHGIALYEQALDRISIGRAIPLVQAIIAQLQERVGAQIQRISPAGSVRRMRETVHDIDILVETEAGAEVIQAFVALPMVTQVLGAGETKGSVLIDGKYQVDVRAVLPGSYGAAQQYFTGSKEHNVRLREIARKQGLKINEYGIFRDEQKLGGTEEDEIYRELKMAWIPPELREDRGEIEAALDNRLPELITLADIKADLHLHSTYSDGRMPIKDMAGAARELGYQYLAICDHSVSARYANGLNWQVLKQQWQEIDALNNEYQDFHILKGTEVDILQDGNLDFPDSVLAQLDWVVASIHASFTKSPTERIIAAMQNPYVNVISHPTGRLISRREGYEIDVDRVLQAAANTGTAMEINAYWDRLDLSDVNARRAIDMGVKISINTDAHNIDHLHMMVLGVGTARRGWVEKPQVVNTYSLEQLRHWRQEKQQKMLQR